MIDHKITPSPKSPCISYCIINTDNGFCGGCWRTLDEISMWRTLQDTPKFAILKLLKARRFAAGQLAN